MHVEPKHIATGAVMTVLLALFLFWQGDADGMDQQPVQMEQGASDGRSPDQAAKKQMAARYEKIRGMESQVAIEDLRNPFSPAHEKRGETVTAPVGKEKPSGKATPSQERKEPLQQLAPVPQGTGASAAPSDGAAPAVRAAPEEKEPRAVLALRGIVQGQYSRSSSCRTAGRANRLQSASASSPMRSSRSAGRACGCAGLRARYG